MASCGKVSALEHPDLAIVLVPFFHQWQKNGRQHVITSFALSNTTPHYRTPGAIPSPEQQQGIVYIQHRKLYYHAEH